MAVVFVSYAVEGDENPAEQNGLTNAGKNYQAVLDEKLSDLDSFGAVSAVIMDDDGNLVAQKGDIDRTVTPGSALRPIIAAEVLEMCIRDSSLRVRLKTGDEILSAEDFVAALKLECRMDCLLYTSRCV